MQGWITIFHLYVQDLQGNKIALWIAQTYSQQQFWDYKFHFWGSKQMQIK